MPKDAPTEATAFAPPIAPALQIPPHRTGSHARRQGPVSTARRKDRGSPLVIDLDGTLTPSDLLLESFFQLLARDPFSILKVPFWLLGGKAALKARIAERTNVDIPLLPLNKRLVSFIRDERSRGRQVYLASASDRRYVEAMAEHTGLFDGVFASDGVTNMSGEEKAKALCEAFGEGGFDYVGNSHVDLKIWEKSRCAFLVDVSERVRREATNVCRHVHDVILPRSRMDIAKDYFRAMRPHQWLKNLLVFLPAMAAHSFDAVTLGASTLAFVAFCLCASSVYLLNDLVDLSNDRAHPTKRNRPFASGAVPLAHSLLLIPLLLAGAIAVAATLPFTFMVALAVYYVTTLLYSFFLKKEIVIDVITLSGLYTLRVLAGAAAASVVVSEWLLVFSVFLFLCLAWIKRYSELVGRNGRGSEEVAGRGYRTGDTPLVGALAGAGGFVAVLVLALYIGSPEVNALYNRPDALWGVGILLLYWVSRALMLAHRGQVDEDPVVFAIKDRVSLVTVGLAGVMIVLATLP